MLDIKLFAGEVDCGVCLSSLARGLASCDVMGASLLTSPFRLSSFVVFSEESRYTTSIFLIGGCIGKSSVELSPMVVTSSWFFWDYSVHPRCRFHYTLWSFLRWCWIGAPGLDWFVSNRLCLLIVVIHKIFGIWWGDNFEWRGPWGVGFDVAFFLPSVKILVSICLCNWSSYCLKSWSKVAFDHRVVRFPWSVAALLL